MKIVITTFFTLLLSLNFLNAQETKQMSDEELLKQIMLLHQESEEIQESVKKAKAKTQILKDENKALEKLENTVDELVNTLGVDK